MDGEKKEKTPELLSEEEMMRLLLYEDETFHDEGKDAYMDVLLEKIRKDLGTTEDPKE
ncbi:MAG: hypothetical protein MJZ68_07195 [archaeon]|nr:hypothetical protein [archaeon]